jgi:hypothetical protein
MQNLIELPTENDIQYYQKLRKVGIELNHKLFKMLPKAGIIECAKKLGVAKSNYVTVNNDEELAVLTDYCLFHYRKNKVNVISRYLLMTPPEKDSPEMEILTAMEKAHYSLFMIEKTYPNKGIVVSDLSTQQEIFVIDIALSNYGIKGLIMAGHLVPIGQFYRTSGIAIPISPELFNDEIKAIVFNFIKENEPLPPAKQALFSAQVIRAAFKAGMMDHMGGI